MFALLVLLVIPLAVGAILCCNMCNGVPPPDGVWVYDRQIGGMKYRRI